MSRGIKLTLALMLAGLVAAVYLTRDLQHVPPATDQDKGQAARAVADGRTDQLPTIEITGFVGSQACADCHQDIVDSYLASPMGRSLSAAGAEPIDASFTAGSREYAVTVEDDALLHQQRLRVDGELVYEQQKEVSFILGSGKRGRSFLVHEGDRLFQSPIGWYRADGGTWDLSPGYDPQSHPGFSREINDGCLYCHAGRTNPQGTSHDRYGDPVFHEMAIGCERCHGPGEAHVAFHAAGDLASQAAADPIVNPAQFDDPALRDDVCNQCHLLGQSVIRRKGRTFFSFQPGERLEDCFVMLTRPPAAGEAINAVSQVEQMRSSQCFIQSEGRLGCVSCHDPHSSPAPQNRVAHFRDRCLQCHQDQGCSLDESARQQRQNSCIACHMPRRPTADVPHTSLTHHGVIRPGAARTLPPAEEGLHVFPPHKDDLSQLSIDRAKGITLMSAAWSRSDRKMTVEAMRHLFDAMPLSPEPMETRLKNLRDLDLLEELGAGYFLLERTLFAKVCWERLLELEPENTTALLGLGQLAWQERDEQRYQEILNKLAEVAPLSPDYFKLQLQLSFRREDASEAVRWGEKLVRRSPESIAARSLLIEAYRKAGEQTKADEQAGKIEALQAARTSPER